MLVPNRNSSSDSYRYGFQGQEKDDEIKGEGNSLNYTFRMHDPRVGRFFATDPLEAKYPWYTPYQFSCNKVISCIELEGLEEHQLNNGETVNGPFSNEVVDDFNQDFIEGNAGEETFNSYLRNYSPISVNQIGGQFYTNEGYTKDKTTGQFVLTHQYKNVLIHPRFRIQSDNAKGTGSLKIIQFVNASDNGDRDLQRLDIGDESRIAFVDGGRNSPSNINNKNDRPPFYGQKRGGVDPTKDKYLINLKEFDLDGVGEITIWDYPLSVFNHSDVQFESYLVISNYKNSSKIKIVAKVDWGFDVQNGKALGKPPVIAETRKFSENANLIFKNDYGSFTQYSIYGDRKTGPLQENGKF